MGNPWQDLARPPLRERELRRALTAGPQPGWRSLDVVEVTGSTNSDLAQRARDGEAEGCVLVAEEQRAGRGRRDRSWLCPPRAGLTVSVLLRPAPPAERWSWLGLLAGVALTDALQCTCGLAARLKWPNDVLVPAAGRPGTAGVDGELLKVAGLLAEVVHTPAGNAVVLGFGINVSQDVAELPGPAVGKLPGPRVAEPPGPAATSLRLAGAATWDRDTVLRAVLRALAERYRDWSAAAGDPRPAGLAAAYRERCVTIGRQVRVEVPGGTTLIGLADGVDDEGRLLLRESAAGDDGGAIRALSAGDVVHLRGEPA